MGNIIPTVRNNGKIFKTRYHKIWDSKVRNLVGGLTIMPPNINGEWLSPEGKFFAERIIPVRIFCTEKEMNIICKFTKEYYIQEAIMYYEISNNVKIYK